MRNLLGCIVYLAICLTTAGCVSTGTTATVTSGQNSPNIDQVQAEAYNGPKARVAVAQFKDKTGQGWWTGKIGNGMSSQMTTALFNTNRYIVLEREVLDDVLGEQDLGASGRIRQGTAAPIGQIEGAELLIVGAVTEFEGNASGGGGAIGGIGGFGAVLGAVAGGFKKAHMAIDIRVIDARTSRIVAATSVEGESTDINFGGAMGGLVGGGALAGGLAGWKNTPTEKALRVCIQKAVDFIVTKTPQSYYHHGGGTSASSSRNSASTKGQLSRTVIKELQSKLNMLGFPTGKPDGVPGKKTAAALRLFQQSYGLPATGSFDSKTVAKIRELTAS